MFFTFIYQNIKKLEVKKKLKKSLKIQLNHDVKYHHNLLPLVTITITNSKLK